MPLHLPLARTVRRGAALAAALAACLATSGSCSNNSLNGGLATVCLEFTPDASCSTAQVVAQQGADSTCDTLVIELTVKTDGSVTDVFGAKLLLGHDPEKALFLGAAGTGSFLSKACSVSGTACSSASEDCPTESCLTANLIVFPTGGSNSNSIPVTITRSGVSTGVTPTAGKDLLLSMQFLRLDTSGSTPLTFVDGVDATPPTDDATLFDPGTPPQPRADIAFCGGTITIH